MKRIAKKTREQAVESHLDEMADDGRLGAIAKRLAIEAGKDWPSLDGDEQDYWNEQAIIEVRRSFAGRAKRAGWTP